VSAGEGFGGRSNRIKPMDERIVEKTESDIFLHEE
jgi:hypothetical protein